MDAQQGISPVLLSFTKQNVHCISNAGSRADDNAAKSKPSERAGRKAWGLKRRAPKILSHRLGQQAFHQKEKEVEKMAKKKLQKLFERDHPDRAGGTDEFSGS